MVLQFDICAASRMRVAYDSCDKKQAVIAVIRFDFEKIIALFKVCRLKFSSNASLVFFNVPLTSNYK